MKIKKILVPTDFSETAEKAFQYSLFLADTHGAELTLLHVVGQPQAFDLFAILLLTPEEIAEKMVEHAHQDLQVMVKRANDTVAAKGIVRRGKNWDVICKTATEENADIIVIASQGRTGLSNALIGSVAEKVVRHASCPVLVVRNPTQ